MSGTHRPPLMQSAEEVHGRKSSHNLCIWKQMHRPSTSSWQAHSGCSQLDLPQILGGSARQFHRQGGSQIGDPWANAGVVMLVMIGADQATAAPAPMRFSILRRETMFRGSSVGSVPPTVVPPPASTDRARCIGQGQPATLIRGKVRTPGLRRKTGIRSSTAGEPPGPRARTVFRGLLPERNYEGFGEGTLHAWFSSHWAGVLSLNCPPSGPDPRFAYPDRAKMDNQSANQDAP